MRSFIALVIALIFLGTTTHSLAQKSSSHNAFQEIYTHPTNDFIIKATTKTADSSPDMVFAGVIAQGGFAPEPSKQGTTLVVRRMNPSGNFVWERAIKEERELVPHSIEATEDEGFIIGGTAYPKTQQPSAMFLLKLDKNGKTDWIKYYETRRYEEERRIPALAVLNAAIPAIGGGYIGVGYSEVYNPQRFSVQFAATIIRTDDSGVLIDRKIMQVGDHSDGLTIRKIGDEGYAVLLATINNFDAPTVVRLDPNLHTMWTQQIQQSTNAFAPRDLTVISVDEIVVTGMLHDLAQDKTAIALVSLRQFDGQIQWQQSYYYRDSYDTYFPESIQTDSNNNLYIGGEIQFDDGHNFDDNVFVLKTDERGRALQLVEYGKLDRPEYVEELTVFDDASYFFGGFTDYLDSDGYLVKADQSGDSNCDQSYHEVESVYYPYTVQAKTSKSYHVHILTSEPEVENVAAESDPMLCQAESRGRTTKLEDTNLLTTEHQLLVDKPSAAIMIYPNPNQGSFQVNLPVEKSFERAALYNSKGQLVKQLNTKELQGVLHFENYAKGVYYLKISDVQRTESHKIVVH